MFEKDKEFQEQYEKLRKSLGEKSTPARPGNRDSEIMAGIYHDARGLLEQYLGPNWREYL
jgi:hypothetical protein